MFFLHSLNELTIAVVFFFNELFLFSGVRSDYRAADMATGACHERIDSEKLFETDQRNDFRRNDDTRIRHNSEFVCFVDIFQYIGKNINRNQLFQKKNLLGTFIFSQ